MFLFRCSLCAGMLLSAGFLLAQSKPSPEKVSSGYLLTQSNLDRGKYLVENVAMCGDCHTPMGPDGKPDQSKLLKGATLGFQPIQTVPQWHKTAPDLTSTSRLFERWKEEGLVKFFETGLGPSGHAADPPMPTYKMKPEDAEAVVAYLKSLK